jgi:hypothetical protein
MRAIALALVLLHSTVAFAADSDFLAKLQDLYPDYKWDSNRLVSVDLNRDGSTDAAALGTQRNQVALAVQVAGHDSALVVIPIDAGQQLGICSGRDLSISAQEQSEAPSEALGETPEGYEICPKCFEIRIDDGDCDPLQFYWDVIANKLNWWRA